MLAKLLIEEIDRLLVEGSLSQRKIAAKLHVSRGTVSAIAGGRRGLYGREAGDDEHWSLRPNSPSERCPRCGYRVYLPCLICTSRDFQQRQAVLRGLVAGAEQPSVPLVERPRQGVVETHMQNEFERKRPPERLLVSPSPCLPVFKSSPAMPLVTLISAAPCTLA